MKASTTTTSELGRNRCTKRMICKIGIWADDFSGFPRGHFTLYRSVLSSDLLLRCSFHDVDSPAYGDFCKL